MTILPRGRGGGTEGKIHYHPGRHTTVPTPTPPSALVWLQPPFKVPSFPLTQHHPTLVPPALETIQGKTSSSTLSLRPLFRSGTPWGARLNASRPNLPARRGQQVTAHQETGDSENPEKLPQIPPPPQVPVTKSEPSSEDSVLE